MERKGLLNIKSLCPLKIKEKKKQIQRENGNKKRKKRDERNDKDSCSDKLQSEAVVTTVGLGGGQEN